ncbi:SDR family NAD(P)-dependent oxidoreductase [Pseudothauera rhizosphaerae]|uniref:SDR family oxidoreductase n=1 Tax=Pseudothauera rhizosphaerae TaxID=2565932 RepID=A0A4S4AC41_9RHOO|nr:SDR family NAD(P)-dependent oxidoreductase [Pseudothauera rhizosphaerae]THF56231.1 SDR family oxidoreductase [Pseudothauera rhizosphaerae]
MLTPSTDPKYADLDGRIALITGGAGGIGRATCQVLAEQGAHVVVADIDDIGGTALVSQINYLGQKASFVRMDVVDAASVTTGSETVLEMHERIDILINCAGVIRRANVVDLTEDEWDRVININLKSVYLSARAIIPSMKRQSHGVIINVASGWGLTGGVNAVAYCAAKGGVVQITKAMAVDHGKDHIRVNCVCPGDTDTPMLQSEALQLGLPHYALIRDGCHRPLGRVGNPREIASVIAFLASNASSFMTGAAVVVDGGGLAGSM